MKALDTNVLVRFLVQDDAPQAQLVNTLLTRAESTKNNFFEKLLNNGAVGAVS